MSRVRQIIAGAVSAAVVTASAGFALAQAPGEKFKPGQTEAKPGVAPGNPAESLEAALANLKRQEMEIAEKLRQLKGEGGKPSAPQFPPFEKLSPEQLKGLIAHLQNLLAEKTKAGATEKPAAPDKGGKPQFTEKKPGAPEKPGKPQFTEKKPGAASQDEILKRLDRLSAEIDDIRRSLKK